MVVKKRLRLALIFMVSVALLISGCSKPAEVATENKGEEGNVGVVGQEQTEEKVFKIGISQIVEHPALDSARQGFIDALEAKGFIDGKNIEIDYQNAQGDMPTLQTIAQNFVSGKKDLILAIATPSAQAAYNATKEIPIVITAVTDPVEAGIANSWEIPGTNVTGTSDATPVAKQFELLKELIPDAKKVGIIYNTSETNSEIQVKSAKEVAEKLGLEIITSGITSTNEIPLALDSLLPKVDVLYTPTDNLVASAMPLVVSKTIEHGVPYIGAERAHVEGGALATEGIDYYRLGFQTGAVAIEILNGKSPKDIPITTLEDTELVINLETARKLNIEIPEKLKETAELIGE